MRRAWALAALGLLAAPAEACRLALVLALDVSSSVDAAEDRLQREGLARAMLAPEVRRAFLAGEPVAVYAFEWSGTTGQTALTPGWVVVGSEEDLAAVAGTIGASARTSTRLATALGAGLAHAAGALSLAPACTARTVDVSGDGIGNEGVEPRAVYSALPFEGVTVNALVIGGDRPDSQLVRWFRREVLHGPGAFLVHASSFEDFEEAMRIKLLRELERPAVSGAPRGPGAG